LVVDTVLSILANSHPNFEIVVVDQSKDDETLKALESVGPDPRLRYVRSTTVGKGNALNTGLKETKGSIIVLTDDDCTVPPNWFEKFASVFVEYPQVAVAFCSVEAGEHDPTAGFIPAYIPHGERMLTSMHDVRHVRGLGAGSAVRRTMVEKIGCFDPMLGPGARFPSCDDRDIAARALLSRYHVYETSAIAVKHFGFRTWQQGRQLAHRDFVAIGAAYSKLLKCGRVDMMYIPAREFIAYALWPPIQDLLYLRQPRGLVRITAFLEGFIAGLRTPVDRATMKFIDNA
jgi:glycosyltransferase involved in cell wall biosynthesis